MDSFLFVVGYKLGKVLGDRGELEGRKIHIYGESEISEEIGGGLYMVDGYKDTGYILGIWVAVWMKLVRDLCGFQPPKSFILPPR